MICKLHSIRFLKVHFRIGEARSAFPCCGPSVRAAFDIGINAVTAELMHEYRNVQKYPLFDRYWRRVSTIEDDKASTLNSLEIEHETYGSLRFTVSVSVTLTSYGELFLSHYFPLDHLTASTVIRIAEKVGNEVLFLSPWPQKASFKEERPRLENQEDERKTQPVKARPGGTANPRDSVGRIGARQVQPRELVSSFAFRPAGR